MKTTPKNQGFTLLELIVTLAVMMIAIGIVLPNFGRMAAAGRVTAASNDLMMIFHAARAQAMRTRQRALVCPSTDGSACGGSNWSNAIMFLDTNKDGTRGGSEPVVRRVQINSSAVTITNRAAATPLIFLPDGTARMGSAANAGIPATAVVSLCSPKAPEAARMVHVGFSSAQTETVKIDNAGAGCT